MFDKSAYMKKYMDAYRRKHKIHLQTRQAIRIQEKRMLVIAKYGGKCKKCGFNDPRALCIDHVNGGGRTDRKGLHSYTFYNRILFNKKSKTYQILCANCNLIKARMKRELQCQ